MCAVLPTFMASSSSLRNWSIWAALSSSLMEFCVNTFSFSSRARLWMATSSSLETNRACQPGDGVKGRAVWNRTHFRVLSSVSLFILEMSDLPDSTSEMALSRVALQLSVYETGRKQFLQPSPNPKHLDLTSSFSLPQLFSRSFASCCSRKACCLVALSFVSVSLLFLVRVSNRC